MSEFHTLNVSAVIGETDDAVRLCFDVPDELRAEFGDFHRQNDPRA